MKSSDESIEFGFKGMTLLMLCYIVSKISDISFIDTIFKLIVLPISFVWGVLLLYISIKKSP